MGNGSITEKSTAKTAESQLFHGLDFHFFCIDPFSIIYQRNSPFLGLFIYLRIPPTESTRRPLRHNIRPVSVCWPSKLRPGRCNTTYYPSKSSHISDTPAH